MASKYCHNCGMQYGEYSNFCTKCGVELRHVYKRQVNVCSSISCRKEYNRGKVFEIDDMYCDSCGKLTEYAQQGLIKFC